VTRITGGKFPLMVRFVKFGTFPRWKQFQTDNHVEVKYEHAILLTMSELTLSDAYAATLPDIPATG
jgi:hypothetical protein